MSHELRSQELQRQALAQLDVCGRDDEADSPDADEGLDPIFLREEVTLLEGNTEGRNGERRRVRLGSRRVAILACFVAADGRIGANCLMETT